MMIDWAENLKFSFGAKYVAEDTASYILYDFDRSVLDGRAVPAEKFARYLGLDVVCDYVSGDCTRSLGIIAFEPQRIYTVDGYIDLPKPSAVAERDIIDRGESGLYNFTVMTMCAHYLYYLSRRGGADAMQLSFGLESVESANKKEIELESIFDAVRDDCDGAESFALKLAMPKNGFKRQTVGLYASMGVNRATLDEEKHLPTVLATLAERYVVPEAAVLARMRELNL